MQGPDRQTTPVCKDQRDSTWLQGPERQHLVVRTRETAPGCKDQRDRTWLQGPERQHLFARTRETAPVCKDQRDSTWLQGPERQELVARTRETTPVCKDQRDSTCLQGPERQHLVARTRETAPDAWDNPAYSVNFMICTFHTAFLLPSNYGKTSCGVLTRTLFYLRAVAIASCRIAKYKSLTCHTLLLLAATVVCAPNFRRFLYVW